MNIFGDISLGNIRNEAASKTYSGGDMYISPQKKMFIYVKIVSDE